MTLPITQERAKELLANKSRLFGNIPYTEVEYKALAALMSRPEFPGTITVHKIVHMIADGKLKE